MDREDRLDVVVVGSIGVDTNVYLPGPAIEFGVEANFTTNLDTVGQAGGFSARGFARLGFRTAFVGSVGDDPLGRFVLDELRRDGIDTSSAFLDPAGTCRSVNLVTPDGRRKNFYDGKGHMTLAPDLAAADRRLAGAGLAHFHLANWARRLLPAARRHGVRVACDLQDAISPGDPYRDDFVRAADVLFVSAANLRDLEGYLRALPEGTEGRAVVVGMGERGCALFAGGKLRRFPPVELPDPVVDTNGAGDGLAVGFLASYVLDRYSLEESVLRGQIAARYACSRKGSAEDRIGRSKLDAIFAAAR